MTHRWFCFTCGASQVVPDYRTGHDLGHAHSWIEHGRYGVPNAFVVDTDLTAEPEDDGGDVASFDEVFAEFLREKDA